MQDEVVYDQVLVCVTSGKTTVYVKYSSDYLSHYCLVCRTKPDNNRVVLKTSTSLSDIMREFAETIAVHTGGFTTWSKVE